MSSTNAEDSMLQQIPPQKERGIPGEASDRTHKDGLEISPDDKALMDEVHKQNARLISSALTAGEYNKAYRLALYMQKCDGVPVECTLTCFWAMAKAAQHEGEILRAREYLQKYVLCIDHLITIDAEEELPLDESKQRLKVLGQRSLDQVIAEIQAEIKAGEAIEDDTDSSDGVLYMKAKGKEVAQEGEKPMEVRGVRKRRNAQAGGFGPVGL